MRLTSYYIGRPFWFVSNSLHVCASALSRRTIDVTKLLITALQNSPLGEATFHSEIKRLFGTQLIRIDLNSGTFRVEPIPNAASSLSWGRLSVQEAIS